MEAVRKYEAFAGPIILVTFVVLGGWVFYSAGDIAAQVNLKLDLLPFSRWTVKSVNTIGVTINDDGVRPVADVAADIVAAVKADEGYSTPQPAPAVSDAAEVATLRQVVAGQFDADPLDALLTRITRMPLRSPA